MWRRVRTMILLSLPHCVYALTRAESVRVARILSYAELARCRRECIRLARAEMSSSSPLLTCFGPALCHSFEAREAVDAKADPPFFLLVPSLPWGSGVPALPARLLA